ncbi:MAG: hypothetical protein OJF47_003803 [Nitrospira sp.]|jgi:hypothetical protein|nr:MAG: hypothetical protein OJF47_003803 [Nitrospira sp.]
MVGLRHDGIPEWSRAVYAFQKLVQGMAKSGGNESTGLCQNRTDRFFWIRTCLDSAAYCRKTCKFPSASFR